MDLSAWVDLVLSRLLAASGQALVLGALVWALCRYLPRLDARTRCWLWWLVATQMVTGLLWPSPISLPLLPADPAPVMHVLQSSGAPLAPMAAADTRMLAAASNDPLVSNTFDGLSWQMMLVLAWCVGVAVMLARSARGFMELRRTLLQSRACRIPWVEATYRALGAELGIARLPRLRISDAIESPQLTGPVRPVLLLPAQPLARMRAIDLRMALHHELTHHRRRDLWWGWLPALAQHLFFFHPLAHLAVREYAFAREAACDAAVMTDPRHAPHDYGRLLVTLGVSTTPAPALAGASPTFRILKRRLLMLQHTASPLRASALALTIGVVLLGTVPYRVTASTAPAAPTALIAPVEPMPTTASAAPRAAAASLAAPASRARPALAAVDATAPRHRVVADASDMPAPPAPPAPPRAPARATPAALPAPPAPPAPPPLTLSQSKSVSTMTIGNGRGGQDSYILLGGKRVTMNGDSDDIASVRKLQRNGEPLLWIRRDGKEYVVRDAAVLAQLQAVHAPVEALGRQQGDLGEKQGALGERQGELGVRQGELGMKMASLSTERAAIAMRQGRDGPSASEAEFDRRMDALSKGQEALARRQEALAREQEPLARQQEVLARKQEAASVTMQRELDRVIGQAIRNGTAQKL